MVHGLESRAGIGTTGRRLKEMSNNRSIRVCDVLCHVAATLMVLVGVVACNADDDMQLSYQHTVQVGLYSTHTHNDTVLTEVSVWGVGREDTLLYDGESLSKLFLNMNLNRCTTEFVVRTQTLEDDLFFGYTKQLKSVSGSKGIAMEITIDTVGYTRTFIDSVAIVERGVNYNESLENIELYIY